jgi:hypothetical protein
MLRDQLDDMRGQRDKWERRRRPCVSYRHRKRLHVRGGGLCAVPPPDLGRQLGLLLSGKDSRRLAHIREVQIILARHRNTETLHQPLERRCATPAVGYRLPQQVLLVLFLQASSCPPALRRSAAGVVRGGVLRLVVPGYLCLMAVWVSGSVRLRGFPIKPRAHLLSRPEQGNSFLCDRDDSTSTGIASLTCSSELG